jgi:hypothetical protein
LEFVSNDSINHENSSCAIIPSKHVAKVVVAIMTEALEESFSLDEFETSVIENVTAECSSYLRGKKWQSQGQGRNC